MHMTLADRLPIEIYSRPVYKKCECCGRVQDIYFHMVVRDAATGILLIGSFDLCAACGKELAQITDQSLEREEAETSGPKTTQIVRNIDLGSIGEKTADQEKTPDQ